MPIRSETATWRKHCLPSSKIKLWERSKSSSLNRQPFGCTTDCFLFQTQPKVMAHLGPQHLKSVPKDQNFQNGIQELIRLSLQKESEILY